MCGAGSESGAFGLISFGFGVSLTGVWRPKRKFTWLQCFVVWGFLGGPVAMWNRVEQLGSSRRGVHQGLERRHGGCIPKARRSEAEIQGFFASLGMSKCMVGQQS